MLSVHYHTNWLEKASADDLFDITTEALDNGWRVSKISKDSTSILEVQYDESHKQKLSFHVNKGGLVLLSDQGQTLQYFLPGAQVESEHLKVNFGQAEQVEIGAMPSVGHTPQTVTNQAMILAAGYATRLEPISGEISGYCKPALPIQGEKSVIQYICEHLASFGITKFIVNTCFLRDAVKQALSKLPSNVEVIFIDEEEASGTAGGVLKALELGHIDKSKPLLVAQGDGILNFDIGALLNSHRDKNAMVTIGAQTVCDSDVHRFGIIDTDSSGQIRGFKEKPSLKEAGSSRLANTGLYVLSENAYDGFIKLGQTVREQGRLYDFAEDYFKDILAKGNCFYTIALNGYWSDIGNPLAYYRTMLDLSSHLQGIDCCFRLTPRVKYSFSG